MSLTHTTGLLLLTLLLLLKPGKTLRYAHSLCLDFAVTSQSRHGQPWCEVQGSVDTKPLLKYDSDSNQVTASGPLGEEVNGTKAWSDLTGTLGRVGRELRMVLPVIQLGTEETTGPPRLQAKLCCQLEAERGTAASWHFSFDGQTALLLDAMDVNWTVVNPGTTGIKEQWPKKQDLAEDFRKLAVGDCGHWLREFLGHWENVPEQEPTEPPLEPSDNQQLPAGIIPPQAYLSLSSSSSSSLSSSLSSSSGDVIGDQVPRQLFHHLVFLLWTNPWWQRLSFEDRLAAALFSTQRSGIVFL
ncbi:retinoic acid early transcript 1E-like isoform X2 [Phacochoerus africanus]|uniref:retinoic acid early transcript 1E-like isoform X2 n=1 Tax=Phacochoerus africanus TaxID=41426 RepID=UPI001FD9DB53|nr:retinoic acid early transcript 1E-like isoform X2 [Phacochoerus africanus]